MSKPEAQDQPIPADPVEKIVSAIPFVLPLAGGVLIFLLAFIAVTMARWAEPAAVATAMQVLHGFFCNRHFFVTDW